MADHNDDERLITDKPNRKCTIRDILLVSLCFIIYGAVFLCGPILMIVGHDLNNKPMFIAGICVLVLVLVLSSMTAGQQTAKKKKQQPQQIDRLETGTSPDLQPSAAPSSLSLPPPYDEVTAPPPSDEAISSVYSPYPAPLEVPSSAYASYPASTEGSSAVYAPYTAPTEGSSAANPPNPSPKVV